MELFGDDIGKEIDELTKTSQIALKLATPRKERTRYHPYGRSFRASKSPSTFKRRDYRGQHSRAVGLQSFFGGRTSYSRKPGGKSGHTPARTGQHRQSVISLVARSVILIPFIYCLIINQNLRAVKSGFILNTG